MIEFNSCCSILHLCPSGTIFIVMCFVVRTVEALAASAFVTSSFAIIANEFSGQVSTVFVSVNVYIFFFLKHS